MYERSSHRRVAYDPARPDNSNYFIRVLSPSNRASKHTHTHTHLHCDISEFDKGLRIAGLHVLNGERTSTVSTQALSGTLGRRARLGSARTEGERGREQERRRRPFFTRPARNGARARALARVARGGEKELFSSGRAHNAAAASGQ